MSVKVFRHIDGILSGHGIDHQHDFIRLDVCLNGFEFIHHLFIYMQAAGGIQNHYIPVVGAGILH